jgi:hypothetical protein
MSEDFEAPPIGGENIPFKEQKADAPNIPQVQGEEGGQHKNKDQKNILTGKGSKKNLFIIILTALLFLLFGLFLGLIFKGNREPAVLPSPSVILPSSNPEEASFSQQADLEKRLESFNQDLSKLDLEESLLNLPAVDYEIRFKLED